MLPRSLPSGHYVTAPIDLPLDSGGQTRALLMRNRILVQDAGVRASIFTFAAYADLDGRVAELCRRGLLLPEISVENIYDHAREHGWSGLPPAEGGTRPLPRLEAVEVTEEQRVDGTPWRRVHRTREGRVHDYLRPDGSTYLRVPGFVFKQRSTWPDSVLAVDPAGQVLHDFGSLHAWFTHWVARMTGGERTFLFVDSRYAAQHLLPLRLPDVHPVYVLHNIHVQPPRHWSSPFPEMYAGVLDRLDGMDAFVTITHRQRDDVARRLGERTSLFAVPHAVDVMPEVDLTTPRDPHRVSLVARLSRQKRVVDAVKVIDLVRRSVPEVRFHVYGDGPRRTRIEEEVRRRGLEEHVTLFGHDGAAKDTLTTSSAFLVTSTFEGWNLAMQESMSRGCPVVAYDIKYGPREQIRDGEDGFLVPDGDIPAMADRVVRLLRSPDLVDRLGTAARERTADSRRRFVEDWGRVLDEVVAASPRRVASVDLRTRSAGTAHTPGRRWPTRRADTLSVEATVVARVHPRAETQTVPELQWQLAAVNTRRGELVEIPVEVHPQESSGGPVEPQVVRVSGSVDTAELPRPCRLRLTVSAENAADQVVLRHGDGTPLGLRADGSVRTASNDAASQAGG